MREGFENRLMTDLPVQTMPSAELAEIIWSDTLEQGVRHLIDRAKAYETVILLYEDDRSDRILAAWAEKDRLQLATRKIGEAENGVEVHTFGLEAFPPGTVVELILRAARLEQNRWNLRRTLYRSILNELSLITVKVRTPLYS
jgi:hypothetical protein